MKSCNNCKLRLLCSTVHDFTEKLYEWMKDTEKPKPKLKELLNDNNDFEDYLTSGQSIIIGFSYLLRGFAELCKNYKKDETLNVNIPHLQKELVSQFQKEMEIQVKHLIGESI